MDICLKIIIVIFSTEIQHNTCKLNSLNFLNNIAFIGHIDVLNRVIRKYSIRCPRNKLTLLLLYHIMHFVVAVSWLKYKKKHQNFRERQKTHIRLIRIQIPESKVLSTAKLCVYRDIKRKF